MLPHFVVLTFTAKCSRLFGKTGKGENEGGNRPMGAGDMENEALLIYLRDVRDLELARYCAVEGARNDSLSFRRWRPTGKVLVALAGAYSLLAVLGAVYGIGGGALVLLFGAFLWAASAGYWFQANGADPFAERGGVVVPMTESQRLEWLLTQAYEAELLPQPYRNLAAVWYLYDCMEASQDTLCGILRQERMENGIQKTRKRLGYMVFRQGKDILRSRKAEANDLASVEKNRQILQAVQRRASLPGVAEEYAKIADNYNRVIGYFRSWDDVSL